MFPALGPAFGVPFQRVGDTTSSGTATVLAIPFLNARLSFYPIMKLGGEGGEGFVCVEIPSSRSGSRAPLTLQCSDGGREFLVNRSGSALLCEEPFPISSEYNNPCGNGLWTVIRAPLNSINITKLLSITHASFSDGCQCTLDLSLLRWLPGYEHRVG